MDVTAAKGSPAASPPATPTPNAEARARSDQAARAPSGPPFRALVGAGMAKARAKAPLATARAGTRSRAEPQGHDHGAAPGRAAGPKTTEPMREDMKRGHVSELDRARDDEDLELGAGKHGKPRGARASEAELLDPSTRHLAQLAPPNGAAPLAVSARDVAHESVVRGRSLEELLPALVRKIAWAGDRQRASVRLELGAGVYAGTTLVVHAEGGKVRVEAFGGGGDLDRLRARLDARLRGHGLDVESVT